MIVNSSNPAAAEIVAAPLEQEISLNAGQPSPLWERAQPIAFCTDWQGANSDPQRQTRVRMLWSPRRLYLRFECHYRELFLFDDSDADGRRDHLWDRDVAEAFLQPNQSTGRNYKEFEVSPNGMWIDLNIFPGGRADLKSGMQRSVCLDEKARTWAAELVVPFESLTSNFDPSAVWRANFFRIEGVAEPRSYYAWQPTRTPQPNFHVPEAFGTLRFQPAPG